MRRAIAFALLLFMTASSVETVAGLVRDGAVHHEDVVSAAAHAATGTGEHGHEDASGPADHEHGEDHQHGTAGDHCTHVHGAAILTAHAFAPVLGEAAYTFSDVPTLLGLSATALTRPPRA